MSDHARLSPSGAHRWMACPGSLALEEKEPKEQSSSYAEEGTGAHELAERTLLSKSKRTFDLEGNAADNGTVFTNEMCEFVQVYVDNMLLYAEGNDMLVEQRVDFSEDIGQPNSFGTADGIIVADKGKELQVHDLKFGRGVQVDAENNSQLMMYGVGALRMFAMMGDYERVRLVIHQPRLGHLSEWTCTVAELQQFAEKAKIAAAMAVAKADGIELVNLGDAGYAKWKDIDHFNPGESQCRWCKAKANCTALAQWVEDTVNGEFENLDEAVAAVPEMKDNSKLSDYMKRIDTIIDWTKAVRAKTERELLDGHDVPDFKLVEGKKGARKWIDENEAIELMKSMRLKKEDMWNLKVISPTQAEKLLKKPAPRRWTRLQPAITQGGGNPSVAPASDKRPALVMQSLEEDFEPVQSQEFSAEGLV